VVPYVRERKMKNMWEKGEMELRGTIGKYLPHPILRIK